MPAGAVVLSALCVMAALHHSLAQECQYRYSQHPPSELSCNPFTSSLQLHCKVTGPPHADFHIQWHASPLESSSILTPLAAGYSIQNVVVDNDENTHRTASSTLLTGQITNEDSFKCVWCGIEVGGELLPVHSNPLCILTESNYTGLTSCSEISVSTNSTIVCVDSSIVSAASLPDGESKTVAPTSISTPSKVDSIYSTVVGAVNTRTPPGDIASTPAANTVMNSEPTGSRVIGNGDGNGGSDERNLDGLYAAIAICIVFLIVILILVVVVVILCRKKYWENAVSYSPRLYETQEAPGSDPVLTNAFLEPTDQRHTSEVGSSISSSLLDIDSGHRVRQYQQIANRNSTSSNRQSTVEHDYSDINEITPRTGDKSPRIKDLVPTKTGAERTTRQRDYDHLDPLTDHEEEKERKEHVYHTLERSAMEDTDGRPDRRKSHMSLGELGEKFSLVESGEYDQVNKPGTLSLEELFDDPKYAALFRKGPENAPSYSSKRNGGSCGDVRSISRISPPRVKQSVSYDSLAILKLSRGGRGVTHSISSTSAISVRSRGDIPRTGDIHNEALPLESSSKDQTLPVIEIHAN